MKYLSHDLTAIWIFLIYFSPELIHHPPLHQRGFSSPSESTRHLHKSPLAIDPLLLSIHCCNKRLQSNWTQKIQTFRTVQATSVAFVFILFSLRNFASNWVCCNEVALLLFLSMVLHVRQSQPEYRRQNLVYNSWSSSLWISPIFSSSF